MLELLTYLAFCIFPIAVFTGGFHDMLTMTIPNKVSLFLLVAFIPVALLAGLSPTQIGWHFAAGALILIFGFTLFAFEYLGGGDVKLLAAAALWIGMELLFYFMCAVVMFGGLLSLFLLMFRSYPLPLPLLRVGWIYYAHQKDSGVPYGLAIASGTLVCITEVNWMANIIG